MKGFCLKFYTYELEKHNDILVHEWLLEFAKKNGLKGGSCFKAIAGYGQYGKIYEESFFELASNTPVQIEFILQEAEVITFLDQLKKEKLDFFYTKSEIEYERLN